MDSDEHGAGLYEDRFILGVFTVCSICGKDCLGVLGGKASPCQDCASLEKRADMDTANDREILEQAMQKAEASPWFYEHERDYAIKMLAPGIDNHDELFKRGFQEGWRAHGQCLLRKAAE